MDRFSLEQFQVQLIPNLPTLTIDFQFPYRIISSSRYQVSGIDPYDSHIEVMLAASTLRGSARSTHGGINRYLELTPFTDEDMPLGLFTLSSQNLKFNIDDEG